MQWMVFPDDRIQVCGLNWFEENKPLLQRFPERFKTALPEPVFDGGQQTAGVRVRLRTDTGSLFIKARYPKFGPRTNMTQFTVQGISTYANGRCWSARVPDMEGGEAELSLFDKAPRVMRDLCLYLPLYGSVEILSIGVDDDARFGQPTPFVIDKPVAFYGTSITQGGCASRPGLSYQDMVGRKYNIDYLNFGFSGRGKCEPEVARVLCEVDVCCFVIDVGQNNSLEELTERFRPFIDILREAKPNVPMLVTTPIFYNAELWSQTHIETVTAKRRVISSAVWDRMGEGDLQLHLLEAKDYLGGEFSDGAVDGGHPNDLGFAKMAETLGPKLAGILKLEK
jgi:hypothetical protein